MLDPAPFVERAERETGQSVRASCEARCRSGDSVIGKAGLLCALDDGLAFVEDAILEPGDVTTTPREAIRTVRLERGSLGTTLVVHTADGSLEFENLAHDAAERIAEAAGLQLAEEPPAGSSALVPEPVSAPSLSLDTVEPREALPAVEPVSARSEELLAEELSAGLAAARETTEVDDGFELAVSGAEERAEQGFEPSDDTAAAVSEAPVAARTESKRKSRRKPGPKRTKAQVSKKGRAEAGPYGWVSYFVALVLAGAGYWYHWSVAVLLGCVGYVLGMYVAEHLYRQRRQD